MKPDRTVQIMKLLSFFKKNRKIKQTVYLHIGMGKAGTSALQHFFKMNSAKLLKHGILYPATDAENNVAHHQFAASLWPKRPYWLPAPSMRPEQYLKQKKSHFFSISIIPCW